MINKFGFYVKLACPIISYLKMGMFLELSKLY